jgi:hypothetical protein
MTTTQRKFINARCKAFSHEPARIYRVMVDTDGSVLVHDSVAAHYTRNHRLSPATVRRIRKIAAND